MGTKEFNFKDLCEQRYSVRAFSSQEIEKEKIDYILHCAQLAPSAVNYQPWIFYVVKSKDAQHKIQQAYDRAWFTTAPLYIIVCKDSSQSWKRPLDDKDYGDVDAAITATHICTAAHEQELGICWVCNFNADMVKDALNINTPDIEPIVIFPIGYTDTENSKVPTKKRKEIDEIVKWI